MDPSDIWRLVALIYFAIWAQTAVWLHDRDLGWVDALCSAIAALLWPIALVLGVCIRIRRLWL